MSDNFEFTMIVGQGCPACATARRVLAERITSGQIEVIDAITDEKGMELANKHNITGVPSMIVNDKATNMSEVCELKRDLSGVICKGKEVSF